MGVEWSMRKIITIFSVIIVGLTIETYLTAVAILGNAIAIGND